MASVKDLKKKIRTTKGTLKITTAMKLVSAAKLSKAQQAIVSTRPYAEELDSTIRTVSALVQNYQNKLLNENESKRAVLLVISSDKGLCGSYNSQLSKKVRAFIAESKDVDLKVYFIGKKVRELVRKDVLEGKIYKFGKTEPTYLEAKAVADELSTLFSAGEFGKVFVAYNVFKSAMNFIPTVKKVLPISLDKAFQEKLKGEIPFDFKYDPSPNEILDVLIPESYRSTVYTCILDALAAEHGSRMAAMDSASKNCKTAIRSLTIEMNKLRQEDITTALIEVVSGAESLNA
ncbi:MAG: ATP synthase F1 subunit gamma [Bdellovibrionales bacterium GWA2_49_15]|nr:MAG: ATP synthase F1 subunit gamma [Bdellovibrionales bacterium GWA2_49_15]